jgi:predicted lipoprotein with Yx(FWY)xxD motif
VIAAATIGGVVALPLSAGAQHAKPANSTSTLQARKVAEYGEVLTDSAGHSLYVLSTESKGKLHCTSSSCVEYWPPLLVAENAKITAGSGVKGKISHVTRGSKWQITYNGWPVYTFAGDSGPGQAKGEKIVGFGGTWYLVLAAATTNSSTPVKTVAGGGTTTTTSGGY